MKSGPGEHLDRVREALEAHREPEKGTLSRRGYLGQRRRREVETAVRRQVVEHVRFRVIEGATKEEVAACLGLPPRTLRSWELKDRLESLVPCPRGRPLKRSSVDERNRLLGLIEEHGPMIGVEMLGSFCPDMARGEIRDILARWREHYLLEHELVYESLRWDLAGRVWAMDHTEPPEAVDGSARAILSVRDLSSGAQILWKEELGPRAAEVIRDLEGCFEREGAPLVLKCDNGSAFIALALGALCARWGVELLWSPPYTPRYNGSAESGIRWLKERTEHVAQTGGRPGHWTAEDLEVAKDRTNQLPRDARTDARPRGQVFQARSPISPEERATFRARLAEERAAERRARGIPAEAAIKRHTHAAITRQAMRRALVALGILTITERRVAPTLKSLRAAKIS